MAVFSGGGDFRVFCEGWEESFQLPAIRYRLNKELRMDLSPIFRRCSAGHRAEPRW